MFSTRELLQIKIERALREIDFIATRTARFLQETEEVSEKEQLFFKQLQEACEKAKAQAEAWVKRGDDNV